MCPSSRVRRTGSSHTKSVRENRGFGSEARGNLTNQTNGSGLMEVVLVSHGSVAENPTIGREMVENGLKWFEMTEKWLEMAGK